jgi:hypothetical protein
VKNRRGPITAEELMAELALDEEYQRATAEIDATRAQQAQEWRRAEAPLVSDLAAVGVQVESVWTLVNTREPYPTAIPILVEHLDQDYPDRVREGIARALAVPEAAFAWDELERHYVDRACGPDAKDGLAVALSETVTGETFDQLVDLIDNPWHGDSRILLLHGLRTGGKRGREVLERLADDPMLGRAANQLLKQRSR